MLMDPRAPAKIKRKSSCPLLRIRGPVSHCLNLTRGLSTSVAKGYFGPPRVGRLAAHRLLEFPAKADSYFASVRGRVRVSIHVLNVPAKATVVSALSRAVP